MSKDNSIHIEGNLVRDPELRFTSTGRPVARITIAYNTRRLDGDTWVDGKASFFDVVCWGTLGENVVASLHKGERVLVEGRLDQSSWVDKTTGEKRYKVEIIADGVGKSLKFANRDAVPVETELVEAVVGMDEAPF